MKKIIIFVVVAFAFSAHANDSIGFVGAGGIQYLKSKDI
ncbi:DUF4424 domain-containing protein [Acinetobacter lanii]|nr:DUF4424 domain-containing protein [Acinetobacter lanii]